jgi:MYXO-CTERM domain-containing protein
MGRIERKRLSMPGIRETLRLAIGPQLLEQSSERQRGLRRTHTLLLRLSVALVTVVSACEPAASEGNATAASEDEPSFAAFSGTVVVGHLRFDDGTGETQYFLRNGDNEQRLWFEDDPGLLPGTHLRVSGQATSEGLRVASYDVEELVGMTIQPLINATPYKPRRFAFVLVDTGSGVNLTKAEAQKRLLGTNPGDRSVKQYYNEVSYGTQDITGEVFGPISYRPAAGCDTTRLAASLKPQIGTFDHYLWYLGSRNSSCGWSGLAEGGQPSRPTNDSWYNASAGCVVLVQEPGHNFGMSHSSSMTCGTTAPFSDNPTANCRHSEYGDRYDPMGGSCNHMNAWQKVLQGWLQKCNGVRVRSSGTYTLQPLELACDGPQVLQIPMPKVRPFSRSGGGGPGTTENLQYYYLELRTARGFDDTIRPTPTVLVRVAEDFRLRTDRGRHTWILDMDPTTRTIDGLVAGKSFTDPAGGVSFRVASISPDSASIEVTIPGGTGGATCLDNAMYDPAVPRPCAALVGTPSGDGGVVAQPDAGTGDVPPPRVQELILVNADTDMDIRPVDDDEVLDLDQLPPNLTLRIQTDPPVVGSVSFTVDGTFIRTESIAPYSPFSDDGRGNFAPWTLSLGAHTVRATPYSAANGAGREGESLELDFTLVRGAASSSDAGTVESGSDASLEGDVRDAGRADASGPAKGGDARVARRDSSVESEDDEDDSDAQGRDRSGGCSVDATGGGASGAGDSWVWGLLALGLFARRRSQRSRASANAS